MDGPRVSWYFVGMESPIHGQYMYPYIPYPVQVYTGTSTAGSSGQARYCRRSLLLKHRVCIAIPVYTGTGKTSVLVLHGYTGTCTVVTQYKSVVRLRYRYTYGMYTGTFTGYSCYLPSTVCFTVCLP